MSDPQNQIELRAKGWNLFASRGLSFRVLEHDQTRGMAHARAAVGGWEWELSLDTLRAKVIHQVDGDVHQLIFQSDDNSSVRAEVLKDASRVFEGFRIEGEKNYRLVQPRRWYSALFRGSKFEIVQGSRAVAVLTTGVAVRRITCDYDKTVALSTAVFATLLVAMHWNAMAFQGEG